MYQPSRKRRLGILRTATETRADELRPPLHRLARAAAQAFDPEVVVAALVDAAREQLGAAEVRIPAISQDGTGQQDAVLDHRAAGTGDYVRFSEGPSGVARVHATGRPYAIPDTRAGGDVIPGMSERLGVESWLFVPVKWSGEVRRVLILAWRTPQTLGPDVVELAELLADQAAAGLARIESDRRRADGIAQDRAVVRAGRALNQTLDLTEVLQTLVEEAALALSSERSGVYLGDAESGAIATAGHGSPAGWLGMHIRAGEGAAGRVLESGKPFVTSDYQRDVTVLAQGGMADFGTAIAVPMIWDDKLRGSLSVGWTTRRHVHEEDMRTLEAIAGLASVACRNAEAYEHVQHAARTDALTGLLNHGAMQVRIREEIARARRDETPLGLVILDLDDFKRVNDTRGHAAGDELLRRVAKQLEGELRPYDQVARYGGDEFVLVLPGSDEAATAHVAERCREAVGGACSIGVAVWRDGVAADALLEQADRALMLAKRTGKGRVAVANAEVERELALLQSESGSPAAVHALAAAIEERDAYTREQSEQTVHLARGVAMMLGLQAADVERIAHAALLHDVGKLAIPAEILQKTGPLTQAEWDVMAEHPVVGERILMRTKDLGSLAVIVRHEHEHWDGSGYPDGLERHRIPIGSRVIFACDAYVAMIATRPYRPALEVDAAVGELRAGSGSKFDPEVVEALLDLLGQAPLGVPDRSLGIRLAATPPPASVSAPASR